MSEAFNQDLRYLKYSTFFSAALLMVFRGSSAKLKVKFSVFFGFIRYLTFVHSVSTLLSSSSDCTSPSEMRKMSSAKSRSVDLVKG